MRNFHRRDCYASFPVRAAAFQQSWTPFKTDEDGSVQRHQVHERREHLGEWRLLRSAQGSLSVYQAGEELVYEPFQRMIAEGKVWSQRYDGFWQCMDTFRDKQILDELEASGCRSVVSVEERPCPARETLHDWSASGQAARSTLSTCSALVRIPTTSRLVAAGRCCICRSVIPRLKFHWVVFSAAGTRGQEATQGCGAVHRRLRTRNWFSRTIATDFFLTNGAEVKDFFEEIERPA